MISSLPNQNLLFPYLLQRYRGKISKQSHGVLSIGQKSCCHVPGLLRLGGLISSAKRPFLFPSHPCNSTETRENYPRNHANCIHVSRTAAASMPAFAYALKQDDMAIGSFGGSCSRLFLL